MYFIFSGVIIAVLFVLSFIVSSIECKSKWADSGRKHEWSVFAGCRVEDSNGKLIPEKNIRDIQ